MLRLPVTAATHKERVMINKKLTLYVWLICGFLVAGISAQNRKVQQVEGTVSYLSSQTVYVKIPQTNQISVGDTLFFMENNVPQEIGIVQFLSSRSIAAKIMAQKKLLIGQKVFVKIKTSKMERSSRVPSKEPEIITPKKTLPVLHEAKKRSISGRVGVSSYSTLSKQNKMHRQRYYFSMHGQPISSYPARMESYLVYRKHNNFDATLADALKVYALSLDLPLNNRHSFSLGRKRTAAISNIGVIDGLQYHFKFSQNQIGVVAGSRPDFKDYSFNSKLFQFGGYWARNDSIANHVFNSAFAIFNQTNNFKTDRRFVYLQHNSRLSNGFNLFISSELDLYKRKAGKVQNSAELTSLFISSRLRPTQNLRFHLSYDARKNIVYYETFKHVADSILHSELRQGVRLGVSYKVLSSLTFNFRGGLRYKKYDVEPAKNMHIRVSWSQPPLINGIVNVSTTWLRSSYLNGQIYKVRYSKDLFSGLLYNALSYRKILYTYKPNGQNFNQDILSYDLSIKLYNKLFFALGFEGVYEKTKNYNYLTLNLSQRF